MIRTLSLALVIMGQVSADDSLGDVLRSAENPMLKIMRGDRPARILDASAGRIDAERSLKEGKYSILRYDMPDIRVGDWRDWKARYDRFGIQERPGASPKNYCDAYNMVMDAALQRKFGDSYKAERSKLLPPVDAQPYRYKREGEQAGASDGD